MKWTAYKLISFISISLLTFSLQARVEFEVDQVQDKEFYEVLTLKRVKNKSLRNLEHKAQELIQLASQEANYQLDEMDLCQRDYSKIEENAEIRYLKGYYNKRMFISFSGEMTLDCQEGKVKLIVRCKWLKPRFFWQTKGTFNCP